jgi:hypothetical protein
LSSVRRRSGCAKCASEKEQARRRSAYDAAVAERDTLAAELAVVYPAFVEQLAHLAARIAANDAVIERINRKGLPDDATWLPSAELVARGLQSFSAGGNFVLRLTEQLRLPVRVAAIV